MDGESARGRPDPHALRSSTLHRKQSQKMNKTLSTSLLVFVTTLCTTCYLDYRTNCEEIVFAHNLFLSIGAATGWATTDFLFVWFNQNFRSPAVIIHSGGSYYCSHPCIRDWVVVDNPNVDQWVSVRYKRRTFLVYPHELYK